MSKNTATTSHIDWTLVKLATIGVLTLGVAGFLAEAPKHLQESLHKPVVAFTENTPIVAASLFYTSEVIRLGHAKPPHVNSAALALPGLSPEFWHYQSLAVLKIPPVSLVKEVVTEGISATSEAAQVEVTVDAKAVQAEQLLASNAVTVAPPPPVLMDVHAFSLDSSQRLDLIDESHLNRVSLQFHAEQLEADLWMQPQEEVVSRYFRYSTDIAQARKLGEFEGVGFPHIEQNDRDNALKYKPYRRLITYRKGSDSDVIAKVNCMGLTPTQLSQRAEQFDTLILDLAFEYSISASLVKAVISKESCFNTLARSGVGAIGLMQLMPETASWLEVESPEDPVQNLEAGVRYLSSLIKRFGSNELALAAYNAGPGNVERYNGIPPFEETERYVADVLHFYNSYVAATRHAISTADSRSINSVNR